MKHDSCTYLCSVKKAGGLSPDYHQNGIPNPKRPEPTHRPPIQGNPQLKPQPNMPTGKPSPQPHCAAAGNIVAADAMAPPNITNSFLNISGMPPLFQS